MMEELEWEECYSYRTVREHALYGSWIIHAWSHHQFYCFYHCESSEQDRVELMERFSQHDRYYGDTVHICEKMSGEEALRYCCQVDTIDEVFRIIEIIEQEAREAFRAAVAEMQ